MLSQAYPEWEFRTSRRRKEVFLYSFYFFPFGIQTGQDRPASLCGEWVSPAFSAQTWHWWTSTLKLLREGKDSREWLASLAGAFSPIAVIMASLMCLWPVHFRKPCGQHIMQPVCPTSHYQRILCSSCQRRNFVPQSTRAGWLQTF